MHRASAEHLTRNALKIIQAKQIIAVPLGSAISDLQKAENLVDKVAKILQKEMRVSKDKKLDLMQLVGDLDNIGSNLVNANNDLRALT